jgi:OOP family OmpA-OmpF porin
MPYPLAAPAVDDTAADDQLITGTESSIPAGPVDTDQDGVFDSADLCANTVPTAKVDGLGCSLDANIVLEGVNFHTDSAKLTDASIAILDGVAKTLTSNPNIKVEVAGHTDSDAADDYNLKLSQSRAETVVAYLASHGVKADHMTARGYGEAAPLVANDNAANKAINRRVELRRL